MRRGHLGGGWRNENPRLFRPRSGGTRHYRPPRGYGHSDGPRFHAPGPRPLMARHPFPNNGPPSDHMVDFDRNSYRGNRHSNPRTPDRGRHYAAQGLRQAFPQQQRMRQGDIPDSFQNTNFYDQPWDTVNTMGDIDHRQHPSIPSAWINPPPYFENRSPTKSYRHQEIAEHHNIPQPDYTGHRPPASDHYGGNHGSTMDNSNTFSRSVNDTVDIVRKRLQNREFQPSETAPIDQNESETPQEPKSKYTQHDMPSRKKHKLRNIKSNCDKIKNKIVHQLIMMDKDKIHKLMDNPNSSSKFEFAISSLVTESQNSYNRHLRSVAEKSLCGPSSSDFIHNDNNTIYEDTFMKQMAGVLDPQDTVLLEDIKPMVLAELCKVLQLDDMQLQQEVEATASYSRHDTSHYDQCDENYESFGPTEHMNYYDQKQSSEFDRPQSPFFEGNENYEASRNIDASCLFERRRPRKRSRSRSRRSSEDKRRIERKSVESRSRDNFPRSDTPQPYLESNASRSRTPQPYLEKDAPTRDTLQPYFESNTPITDSPQPYFESIDQNSGTPQSHFRGTTPQPSFERVDTSPPLFEPDMSKSPTHRFESDLPKSGTPIPLFEPNVDQLSDDEDTFAELDRQYHVAVDHNFIKNEYLDPISPQESVQNKRVQSPIVKTEVKTPVKQKHRPEKPLTIKAPDKDANNIKQDIDNQLQVMAKSPLKFLSPPGNPPAETIKHELKLELDNKSNRKSVDEIKKSGNDELTREPHLAEKTPEKTESSIGAVKNSTPTDSRKRSSEQKPSHRKEKRKKSESSQSETNKQILNKNIIIHLSDCAAKSPDKSYFKLFFSKDNKKESDKKYDRRKETETPKTKEKESKNKHDSSSSSHSITSPDVNVTSNGVTSIKTEGKVKLKPIDMFSEAPKKPNVHQAHRNTAAPVVTPTKTTPVELKPVVLSRKITKRHIATQVMRKCSSKEIQTESKNYGTRGCQTERKKFMTRGSQTEPVSFKPASKSMDSFERMKEIDMEIQALLQEKFKLYNSLESNVACPNTMQSLGMAVLNVAPDSATSESNISEDTIVDEFTSIPDEELEQIALETVQANREEELKANRRKTKTKNQKRHRRSSSQCTVASTGSNTSIRIKKNDKSPNISLIEQIITDDRPLEDIISLDDLEDRPSKKRSRGLETRPKRSKKPKNKVNQATPKKKKKDSKSTLIQHDIKKCSVVLKREDMNKLILKLKKAANTNKTCTIECSDMKPKASIEAMKVPSTEEPMDQQPKIEFVETEPEINDIQFDMLDVSEDIVIGDVCEVKSEEKETGDAAPAISEDIILDNSQSSVAEVQVEETGSECRMYDYSADENLRRDAVTITGNGDAVLAIECVDKNFIAACLDGNAYYFSGEGKLLNTLRGSNLAVTCLTVVKEKYGTTVYTGSLDSRIRYYDLETGLEKGPECNVLSPIQTMDRAWDTVFVGTRTGFVLQFECKNNMLIPVSTVKFSEQSILALRAMKEGPRKVLLVAARSEPVTIKDALTGLLLRTLEGPKMTVYTLLYEDGKVYCGTSSHQIHVFDYSSGSHMGTHSGGKGAVCLRAAGGLVFAGCYDGCVYVYREGEPHPLAQLRGPSLMLLSLAIADSNKLIAGYKDRSLYIWKIPTNILQEMIL